VKLVVDANLQRPGRIVFEAWTKPELFNMVGSEVDGQFPAFLRDGCSCGGRYRVVFGEDASNPDEFFGRYNRSAPHSRLV